MNGLTVGAFNSAYYRFNVAARKSRQHYAQFFYPLDAVRGWNRLYGRYGMLQYQCVIPPDNQREGIAALLDVIPPRAKAPFLRCSRHSVI